MTGASRHERPARDRAADLAAAGHRGEADPTVLVDAVRHDPAPEVRTAAVGALVRLVRSGDTDEAVLAAVREGLTSAMGDAVAAVRRRAAEAAAEFKVALDAHGLETHPTGMAEGLLGLVDDGQPLVAEAAAFALGEWGGGPKVTAILSAVARDHPDPVVREAAVAALGALGDPDGLPALLAALDDRAPVRRRAVLALAPFEGEDVEAALRRALDDRDWQVRQAAEDLLG